MDETVPRLCPQAEMLFLVERRDGGSDLIRARVATAKDGSTIILSTENLSRRPSQETTSF